MQRPLLLLGVSRSGTTLLRVVVDRNSQIAVPDESFFVPLLARRHRGRPDPDAFADDVARIERIREWGVAQGDLRRRLRAGMTTGEAIAAVYEAYAAARGKARWGDKTPMYMRHLRLLERLFPSAQFVHLVRDGRDAAVSFLALPPGVVARTWATPASVADFACAWRGEVSAARSLGERLGPGRYLELRYEDLVAEPEGQLARVCEFAGLPFEREMLDYAGKADVADKPHQRRLEQAPTPGVRDWRRELPAADAAAFEAIAGDLLADLGYETRRRAPPDGRARIRLARYRARAAAWEAAVSAFQRSPLWARRHPVLT